MRPRIDRHREPPHRARDDRAVARDQRGGLAVADQRIVLDACRHVVEMLAQTAQLALVPDLGPGLQVAAGQAPRGGDDGLHGAQH